jgi:hypothetical protein
MLTYTATDLVEIIRREMDAAASRQRVHTTGTPGFLQQLRRRAASARFAKR